MCAVQPVGFTKESQTCSLLLGCFPVNVGVSAAETDRLSVNVGVMPKGSAHCPTVMLLLLCRTGAGLMRLRLCLWTTGCDAVVALEWGFCTGWMLGLCDSAACKPPPTTLTCRD